MSKAELTAAISMKRWTEHTHFTRPGGFADELAAFGPSLDRTIKAVQGLLIHGGALEQYGVPEPDGASRDTLPVEARLADIRSRWSGSLIDPRPTTARSIGTCRDFALLTCATLRSHGRPARVRCGFASYFQGAPWEDHWLCEVWAENRWLRVDAQLDEVHRDWLEIAFNPCDVPLDKFLSADDAWRRSRSGQIDPDTLGHGDARGLWFAYVNLVRDRLAVADCFVSEWDGWRATVGTSQDIDSEIMTSGDHLAGEPFENELPSPRPWWRALPDPIIGCT